MSSAARSSVALAVLLAAFWLACSGHYSLDPEHRLIAYFGVSSCAGVLLLARRMGIVDREAEPVFLLGRLPAYLPYLLREVVLSNLDVARRVLEPGPPVSPEILDVETTQESELGRVLYANSITLTPGTVSILVHGRKILVHAITREAAAGLETGEMDRRVTRLEGGGGER